MHRVRMPRKVPVMLSSIHQPRCGSRHTGMRIESVSVLSVCGPSMSGGSRSSGGSSTRSAELEAILGELRVGVAHLGEVSRPRSRVELPQHLVGALVLVLPGDHALGVVEGTEADRARSAGLLAGGHDLAVFDHPPLAVALDAGGDAGL